MMFEQQNKSRLDKLKASSSTMDEPFTSSPDAVQSSPSKDGREASQAGHSPISTEGEEICKKLVMKQKACDAEAPEGEDESDYQISKRARTDGSEASAADTGLH